MALTKVSTDGVKDDAITSGKIPANAIGNSELAVNSVQGGNLTNSAISNDKVHPSANIAGSKLADNSISLAKLEHGTSSNDGKFLRANNGADLSFESIPAGITINNQVDNRVITATATSDTLNSENNLVFDGTNLGIGTVASGAASIGQDKLDIRGGGIYLNSQSTALSGAINKISFLKLHPAAPSVSYEQGRIEAFTENGYGSGGLDFYYGKLVGGGNYAATHGIRLDHQGRVGIGLINADDYDSYANQLVVYGAGHAGITIRGNYANTGNIYFADGTSGGEKYDGFISYSYPTQRLALGAGGTTRVRVTTDGLTFGSDTAAANALDDYEYGSFTPSFAMTSGGHNITYHDQQGQYVKIGQLVQFQIYLRINTINANGSGILYIGGLPFNATTNTGQGPAYGGCSFGYCQSLGNMNSRSAPVGYVEQNSTRIYLYVGLDSSGNHQNMTVANNLASNNCQMRLAGSYQVE